jgi:hypothetical protein
MELPSTDGETDRCSPPSRERESASATRPWATGWGTLSTEWNMDPKNLLWMA